MGLRGRFGVDEIEAAREWVASALGVEPSPTERVEGLVTWCNFDDPWGNRLGVFQDLAREADPGD